jgi:hypothetical protein
MRDLESVLGSKTKAYKAHGLLEGDYKIATQGFYTNNFLGVKKLYQIYPELISSVQSVEQFTLSEQLTNRLIED